MLSSGLSAPCSLPLYRSMLLKISLPPLLFIHTLVACPPGLVHNHALSHKPCFLSVLRCSSLRCQLCVGRSAPRQPARKHKQRGLETGLKSVRHPTGHAVGLRLIQDSRPGLSGVQKDRVSKVTQRWDPRVGGDFCGMRMCLSSLAYFHPPS